MKSKNIKKKIELLAPVGSFESLHAAIQAGADAIYFGVAQLNMRAKSINSFFLSDLPLIQATCSQHHIKTYITLNTVMYEHDMQLLKTCLLYTSDAADDLLCVDLGGRRIIKKKNNNKQNDGEKITHTTHS